MPVQMSRRSFLRAMALASSAGVVAACQPKVVEKVVKETVEVEKVVKETIEVEKVVEKEKVVKETIVVEVAKTEPVTIQVWTPYVNPDLAEPFAVLKDKWAEVTPEIIVNETSMAGTQDEQLQKIAAAVAAGVPPDLWGNTSPKTWGQRGMVIPLTPFADLKGNWDPDDVFPNVLMHYTDEFDGTLYGFMFDSDSRGLYWRKYLFEQAGLDPEQPPKTWSELRAMAQKLTVKSGDFYDTIGFIPTYGQGFNWGYIGQAGGWPALDWSTLPPKWRLNTPEAVRAIQFMVDVTNDYGGVTTIASFQEGFQGDADQPFFTGQIAMMINGVWILSSIERYAPDLQYGVTNEPIADEGGTKATLSGGWGWAVPVGSLHPPEAWEFMSWLWEAEQLVFWNFETAHIPPKKSVAKDPVFQEGNFAFFSEAMSWNGGWPAGPWTEAPGYTLDNAQDDAMLGNLTVQQALDQAQAEYQRIADEYYMD